MGTKSFMVLKIATLIYNRYLFEKIVNCGDYTYVLCLNILCHCTVFKMLFWNAQHVLKLLFHKNANGQKNYAKSYKI